MAQCPREQSDKVVATPSRQAGAHRAVLEADGDRPACVEPALLPPALGELCCCRQGVGKGPAWGHCRSLAWPPPKLASFYWLAAVCKVHFETVSSCKMKFLQVATVANPKLPGERLSVVFSPRRAWTGARVAIGGRGWNLPPDSPKSLTAASPIQGEKTQQDNIKRE